MSETCCGQPNICEQPCFHRRPKIPPFQWRRIPPTVTLPWPPAELNPNKRVHWAKKSKAAKAYRETCFLLAKQAGLQAPETDGRIALWLDFFPPDRRRRDDDNLVSAFKAGRDGLADALGIDDKRFVAMPFVQTEARPGGCVRVRLSCLPRGKE